MDPKHIVWSARLWASLKEGGIWGVPRSGLIFKREGNSLVLKERAPFFSKTAQDSDIDAISEHFKVIGVTVKKDVP